MTSGASAGLRLERVCFGGKGTCNVNSICRPSGCLQYMTRSSLSMLLSVLPLPDCSNFAKSVMRPMSLPRMSYVPDDQVRIADASLSHIRRRTIWRTPCAPEVACDYGEQQQWAGIDVPSQEGARESRAVVGGWVRSKLASLLR